jgi:hypothetical protein
MFKTAGRAINLIERAPDARITRWTSGIAQAVKARSQL